MLRPVTSSDRFAADPQDPEAIPTLIAAEKPDIICLQETKLQEKNIGEVEEALQLEALGYTAHWRCAVPPSRLGYSGVAVLLRDGLQVARVVPANVEEEADCEGRVLTAEVRHCRRGGGALTIPFLPSLVLEGAFPSSWVFDGSALNVQERGRGRGT